MKLVELKCKSCGATMKINSADKEVVCEYCGTKFLLDEEPQTSFNNAEEAGYAFEKGRQKAQAEQYDVYVPVKKKRTWLWVIGWILIFPLPLTILMVRNKKLSLWLRIAIIAVAWIVYLLIGLTGETEKTATPTESLLPSQTVQTVFCLK